MASAGRIIGTGANGSAVSSADHGIDEIKMADLERSTSDDDDSMSSQLAALFTPSQEQTMEPLRDSDIGTVSYLET